MAMSETLKRIQRARTILLIDQPFFGVLALQLEIIESTINDTAWTDGKRLGFNPAFVAKLSQDELIGVVAHEVMHPACGHPWREGGREHKRWNAAADYAINPIIKGAGLKLPAGCLDDPQYHGKSAEWIYDRLPPSQESDGCGIGETKPGDGEPGEGDTPVTEADWQQLAKQAMQAAKIQGKLPANMARELERATKPIVDWRTLLRKYLQQITTADYTWTRPNKRYLSHGIILPSLRSLACGKIAIAVDTSGSIDQVTLAQFAGEMQSIIDDMSPSSTEVVYCDAAVHRVDTFERGDVLKLNAVGGGGTNFSPVFDHFATADTEPPVVLIYFTDMYGSFPASSDYPVIWASTSGIDTAPFGDVVPLAQ